MLSLENLVWTIPGLCFLFSYNRLRDVESLDFSGWPFVFFIVLIGTITWLPLKGYFKGWQLIIISSSIAFLIPFIIKFSFEFFVKQLEKDANFFRRSNFWSIIYFFYPLENRDKFIKNCVDYEGEAILVTTEEPITIKNNTEENKEKEFLTIKSKIFFGILVEFPYIATRVTDSQVIRILPLLSGYQYTENCKEKIKWTQKYNITKDSVGIIIPRDKILNFCPYVESIHDKLIFGQDNISD